MGNVTSIRSRKKDAPPAYSGPARPFPPAALVESELPAFAPAPEVGEWFAAHVLDDAGRLFNPEHKHLRDADIAYLWARGAVTKQGRTVLGTCEQVAIRAGGWQKQRQEAQFLAWFGRVPTFLITLAGDYCAQCGDTEFAALLEHEHYHIGQKCDEFGEPAFTKDGYPKLGMRGHDVEEFVGVVRRYGMSPDVRRLVEAAAGQPEVAHANIAACCGTCMERAA